MKRLIATAIVLAATACTYVEPLAQDDTVDLYGAVRALVGETFSETPIARINIALARAPDAPLLVKTRRSKIVDVPVSKITIVNHVVADEVAADYGPDPECSWKSGSPREKWDAFWRCHSSGAGSGQGCALEVLTEVYDDGDGVQRVRVIGFHVRLGQKVWKRRWA